MLFYKLKYHELNYAVTPVNPKNENVYKWKDDPITPSERAQLRGIVRQSTHKNEIKRSFLEGVKAPSSPSPFPTPPRDVYLMWASTKTKLSLSLGKKYIPIYIYKIPTPQRISKTTYYQQPKNNTAKHIPKSPDQKKKKKHNG